MRQTSLAAVALLLIGAAGCHRNEKAEKIAALESAYHSGVFTKSEYEAKKAALLATPPPAPAAPAPPVPVAVQPPAPAPPPPVQAPPPVASAPARPAPRPVKSAPRPIAAAPEPPPTPPVPAAAPEPPAPPPPAPAPQPVAKSEPEAAPTPGCQDSGTQPGKEKGARQHFYPAPVDAVKRAAQDALRKLDFTIHKNTGNRMEASKRRHIGALVGAGGEHMLLRFENSQRGNQTGTLVTGETRKSFVGRLAQKSWTDAVLAQIACQLSGR